MNWWRAPRWCGRCTAGDLDNIEIPDAPMDVLAQQIVAMCACEDWKEDELFARVRRAYPYRNLERSEFEPIIEMLVGRN